MALSIEHNSKVEEATAQDAHLYNLFVLLCRHHLPAYPLQEAATLRSEELKSHLFTPRKEGSASAEKHGRASSNSDTLRSGR
jgi:hypothetical protein